MNASPLNSKSEAGDGIKSSHGLIAFFDVLGYRQIIANNEIKVAAAIIKKTLKRVTDLKSAAERIEKKLKFAPATKYLVFSDSILVYTDYSHDEKIQKNQAGLFVAGCAGLICALFEEGLPARGAVAEGEFFVEEASFAGKAIVEAYEFANSIEMAGCVIVPTAEKAFAGISDPLRLLFSYAVPLKGHQKQKLLTLNPCFGLLVYDTDDTRQFTIEQFSRHKKNISPEVVGKLNNTVDYLEMARVAVRTTDDLNVKHFRTCQSETNK